VTVSIVPYYYYYRIITVLSYYRSLPTPPKPKGIEGGGVLRDTHRGRGSQFTGFLNTQGGRGVPFFFATVIYSLSALLVAGLCQHQCLFAFKVACKVASPRHVCLVCVCSHLYFCTRAPGSLPSAPRRQCFGPAGGGGVQHPPLPHRVADSRTAPPLDRPLASEPCLRARLPDQGCVSMLCVGVGVGVGVGVCGCVCVCMCVCMCVGVCVCVCVCVCGCVCLCV